MPLTPGLTKFTTTSPTWFITTFADTITGRANVALYLSSTLDSVGADHIMLGYVSDTAEQASKDAADEKSADWLLRLDVDFDVEVPKPFRLEGDVLINMSWAVARINTNQGRIIVRIKKNDVEIASVISEAKNPTTGNWTITRSVMRANIASRELFKAGDILRVTVEAWTKGEAGANSAQICFTHDPTDADYTPGEGSAGTITNSQFKIFIPAITRK